MNPSPGIRDAAKAYEVFHWGEKPKRVIRAKLSPMPRAPLMALGRLEAVTYSTKKKGDGFAHYHHKFESKKPILTMDLDNQRLHVVGGNYTVTKRGIEG